MMARFYRASVTQVSPEGFTPTFFGNHRPIRDAEKRDPGVVRQKVDASLKMREEPQVAPAATSKLN
jgi:hypothetical protein